MPKWRTIVKVVLPTAIAGIATGVMLAIARVIGETAPLLITAGFTDQMNYDLFNGRMTDAAGLHLRPVRNQASRRSAVPSDRAWAGGARR